MGMIFTQTTQQIISDDFFKQNALKFYLSKRKDRYLLDHSLTPSQTFDFQIMLNYPVLTVKQGMKNMAMYDYMRYRLNFKILRWFVEKLERKKTFTNLFGI